MDLVEYDNEMHNVEGCPHDVFYITPIPLRRDGLFYQVNRAGITCCTPPDFCIKRNDTYAYNVVHCVISGSGSVTVHGKTHPLRKGQVFLLSSYESHTYCSDPHNPMGLVWAEFAGSDSDRLCRHILETEGPIFSGRVFQEVMDLCTSILYHPDRGGAKVSNVLYTLLITLCCQSTARRKLQQTADQLVLDYIDAHLGERLSLAMISQTFGYNASYFSALFSKISGMPFSQYLIHRRMSRACCLLMTTNWSLEQIAQDLGFYDISHFIRSFKSIENVTPARYRRESYGLTTPISDEE